MDLWTQFGDSLSIIHEAPSFLDTSVPFDRDEMLRHELLCDSGWSDVWHDGVLGEEGTGRGRTTRSRREGYVEECFPREMIGDKRRSDQGRR